MLSQRLTTRPFQPFRAVGVSKGSLGAKKRTARVKAAQNEVAAAEELSVEIPTRDARSSIRFTVVPTGPASQAIVVEAVADSSSAAEAGIQRGMKLAAISDPVRRNEVWELQDRPSIRYIRDVLRMRSSAFIEMRFVRPTAALMTAMEAADDALRLTASTSGSESDSSSSSSGAGASPGADTAGSITALTSLGSTDESSGGSTMAERMQQQFEQKQNASQEVVAFKQRQQRRKDYMEQQGQGSNNTIVLILAASFLLPALVILAVAYGSGYLDALYSNTMSNMR